MKKKIILLSIVVLVISFATLSVYQSFQPLEVSTIDIEKSDFEEYHIEEGSVKAASRITIYASESESLLKLYVGEGDFVKKGDVLVKLDDLNLQNELAILESQKLTVQGQMLAEKQVVANSDIAIQNEAIELAKRDADALETTFNNNKILYESGSISQDVYSKSETAYTNAVGRLSIEESKLKQLRVNQNLGSGKKQYYNSQIETFDIKIANMRDRIENTSIKSPSDGRLSSFNLKVGDRVTKNTALFSISGKDDYEIEVYALAKKIKTLKVTDKVIVELEVANKVKSIDANITFISTEASELVSALGLIERKVKMLIKPVDISTGEIILGEKLDVKLITFSKEDVIAVSRDFIFPYEGSEALWTIENGKAKIMTIDKIHENASKVIMDANEVDSISVIIAPYSEDLEEGIEVRRK